MTMAGGIALEGRIWMCIKVDKWVVTCSGTQSNVEQLPSLILDFYTLMIPGVRPQAREYIFGEIWLKLSDDGDLSVFVGSQVLIILTFLMNPKFGCLNPNYCWPTVAIFSG